MTQKGERETVVFRAIAGSQRQIKREFGSGIVTSILMSLMIRLAIRYIEGWVEDNLFGHFVPQKFEEAK